MSSSAQAPHRGVIVLLLGLLGLLLCPVFAIMAWLMGKGDLEKIDRGEMDPEGRGLTQAGMILGIVAVALWVLGLLLSAAALLFLTPAAIEVSG